MKKSIIVTSDAIEKIISERHLQTGDYEESISLIRFLNGETSEWSYRKLKGITYKNLVIIYSSSPNIKKGVFFNASQMSCSETNDRLITILQKTLRFCKKYFNGNKNLSRCEKKCGKKNEFLIYPFQYSNSKHDFKLKVSVDTDRRHNRRGCDYLLVTDGDFNLDGYKNKDLTDFLNNSSLDLEHEEVLSENKTCLNVDELEPSDFTIDSDIGFDVWTDYLTDSQRKFIFRPIEGPERLEGAAGTGKTLSLILRCINILKTLTKDQYPFKILFITHSQASKDHSYVIFKKNINQLNIDGVDELIEFTTLQEWCGDHLGSALSEDEYLDRDAKDSKELQKLYILEAFNSVRNNDLSGYEELLSEEFNSFLKESSEETLCEMLQFEIAVVIKGKFVDSDIEDYLDVERPKYGIPLQNKYDKHLVYLVFQKYQELLEKEGRYDSDDIVLSALKQLESPIWKRQRKEKGYSVCFIDETSLFNFNELSVLHYLGKDKDQNKIVYTIDKSQAVGDRGVLTEDVFESLRFKSEVQSDKLRTVFRSSSEIINLAFNVLSSGATLFTNFENPLTVASNNFTESEDSKCTFPSYSLIQDDENMIEETIAKAQHFVRDGAKKNKILIIATCDLLFNELRKVLKCKNISCQFIEDRKSCDALINANNNNSFIVAGIDYVGGLEFDHVLILGVDKGRVPPEDDNDSTHFINYAWHNKMYVAITRARYSLNFFGNKARGVSSILESAINLELLNVIN